MSNTAGAVLAAILPLLVASACADPDRPSVQGEQVSLPTPLRSYDASLAASIGELQAAVTAVGSRLEFPSGAYRPAEPQSLLQVPRVVMRADLADSDDGYVVIYEAVDAAAARQRAQELADYLASGFGQTNYPVDAQFSVGVRDDTIVFASWSRARSSDPERARAIFEAVAGVGESVEVRK